LIELSGATITIQLYTVKKSFGAISLKVKIIRDSKLKVKKFAEDPSITYTCAWIEIIIKEN
jgi:hypothetical protein